MPGKPAVGPPNYVVEKIGTPDPEATQYWVLDLVHNSFDREAVASLGNKYRRTNQFQLAQLCWDALEATNEASIAHYNAMNAKRAKEKPKSKPRGG